eukprot:8907563-Pyramimonas_sp.AAC.1
MRRSARRGGGYLMAVETTDACVCIYIHATSETRRKKSQAKRSGRFSCYTRCNWSHVNLRHAATGTLEPMMPPTPRLNLIGPGRP